MKKYYIFAAILVIFALGSVPLFVGSKTANKTSTPDQSYIALGDSVAAGVGLKNDSDSSACNRTNQAYSHQVAASFNYALTNIACSGATVPAGILGGQNVNELLVSPQLQQLFSRAKPKLISMTIGANDIGWTSIITKCYTGVCGSDSDSASVQANLAVVSANLKSTFSQIQSHYGPSSPMVIVTGYHQVFPQTVATGCTDLTGIDAGELNWGRQVQADINTTIKDAASGYIFVRYVPIDFTGHELCTTDSWVQGLSDSQPYHPTAAGQAAFAKEIITAVKGLK
jgi:lysophospholipase L1-like esterase